MKEEISKVLNKKELSIVQKLNTPIKVQDFLDEIPFNKEENGETYYSPRKMILNNKAHCFEGALFATLCLSFHNIKSFLIDLKVKNIKKDSDHIVCVYELNGFLGAISKTNHSVLRWRDPVYKNTRELVMSYFNEYFLDSGEKTLDSYSVSFNIFKYFDFDWIDEIKNLNSVAEKIDDIKHIKIIPEVNKKFVRKATDVEIKGASVKEY